MRKILFLLAIAIGFIKPAGISSIRPAEDVIVDSEVPLTQSAVEIDDMAQEILDLTNYYRTAKGLKPLTWNAGLASAASVRAKEASIHWSHTRPDGRDWYTVNDKIMYGENLAKNYITANGVVNGWLNSPTHAEVLYYPDFKSIGIAVYVDEYGTKFYAQEFGF